MSADGILRFLAATEENGHELHGLVVARHGHIVAEGWWKPYRAEAVHSLASLSKSFTSTAVGFAVAEGLLSTSDRVASLFPDQLPSTVSENLAALQVEHLLTMSVGHATDSTPAVTREKDWVKAFLAVPIEHPPGSEFLYDTAATYMLSAIVQKVSGQKVIDYLHSRLFEPLHIRDVTWETCPLGVNTGGFGMSATTEALAKLGQLYLQKGEWRGKRILPAQWVERATSARIEQPATFLAAPGSTLETLKKTSDWHQGYGYQFWRCRHSAFRGDGAFGQFCVVMPERDAVVAITSRSSKLQGLLDLIWEHVLPAMDDALRVVSERARRRADNELKEKLASAALALPVGTPRSATATRISGRPFIFEANSVGAERATFEFDHTSCVLRITQAGRDQAVRCGFGRWIDGDLGAPTTPTQLRMSGAGKVASAAAWTNENELTMEWRFFETPHSDHVTARFDANVVRIEFLSSIAKDRLAAYPTLPRADVEKRPALTGRLAS